ncbi:MAG: FprA family A-type flavoprotein, partial [Anaeroplasmataceae bacterium]
MNITRKVINDTYYVGGSDNRLNLFENLFPIPNGVSYNSYVILDKFNVLVDTVDESIKELFLNNVKYILNGKKLDYLILNHLELDHASVIKEVIQNYPKVKLVLNEKAFNMLKAYDLGLEVEFILVKEDTKLNIGIRELSFVFAPMVHWPEVMFTYDPLNKILYSADAFGSFSTLNGNIFLSETKLDEYIIDDMRRYYTNIVGKYGRQVQSVLEKAATLDIKLICPLHGHIIDTNFDILFDKYTKWATYNYEEKGIVIVYASMYQNTKNTAFKIANELSVKGIKNIKIYDVSKTDVSYIISDIFKYSNLLIASPTYNGCIYPKINYLIDDLLMLNVSNKSISLVENGIWACTSIKQMS